MRVLTVILVDTWRTWRRSPFSAITVLVLVSLSVGSVVALFEPLHALVERPLPYRESDRLARISEQIPLFDFGSNTIPERERLSPWFTHVSAYVSVVGVDAARLITPEGPRDVSVAGVTPEFLETLAIAPRLGQGFNGEPATAPVMLISERLWRTVWQASPEVVGSPFQLGGFERRIVGVLPAECDLPSGADVWVPMPTVFLDDRSVVEVIGRLREGVSIDTAAHALDGIRKQLSRRPPLVRGPDGRTVQSLQTFLDGSQESMLRMLLMASLFFLFLACAGIASLLLAQSVRRRREMILRVALGSSRSRLVAQLLADTFLIVCAGGAVGLLLGSLENQWLHSVLPDIGVASIIAPSSIVLVVGLCFGVTIVCGLAPAWRAARANIGQGLKATAEFVELPAGRVRLSYRELLAGVQLMLALALLIGASLLVRTLVDRTGTSSGVKTTDVVTFSLELPRLPALLSVHAMFLREHGMDPFGRYGPRNRKAELGELVRTLEPLQRQEQERNRFFFDAVINRVKSLPAIVAVAAMDPVPFTKEAARPLIRHAFKSKPLDMAAEPSVRYVERRVSPGAFTVLSMPFINGRPFTGEEARDGIDGARPAVINEALARSLWPGQSPLGQHFFDSFWPNQEYRVMGVVANDQFAGVPSAVECSAYVPFTGDDRVAGIVAKLRPGVQDGDVQEDLSRILADIPPRLPRPQVQRLDTLAASSLKDLHLMVALLTAFSVLGAVVAALGVYGTVTLIAAARAKEMAIRLALGGSLWRVRGLALWQGLRMASAAIPIGLLVGWILATNLARSVPMHTDGNLLIYGASSVLVSGIAVLAGLMPVLRIDPIKTAAIMRQP